MRPFEYSQLQKEAFGRFGSSGHSIYGGLIVSQEYIVMGIIIFQNYQGYVLDDGRDVSVYPCQLFEITDSKISSDWHFRLVEKDEDIYPFIQTIIGYSDLCFEKNSYENLIVDKDPIATRKYFERKAMLS